VILCCLVPELPLAALVLREGDASLAHRPLVVGGLPSERKPVRAATAEARSFGICAGMPLRQAEQLCPQALFLPVDPRAEADLARHLLAGLYALAPRVELAEGGEAYIEVDGLGDQMEFAARVAGYLERRLLSRPALGIASGKFVARTAAGLAAMTPCGASVRAVPAGSERSFLAPLSVLDHLPVDPGLIGRMKLFGLRTMADLARLPLASVEAQFGAEGRRALRLARGEDTSPLVPWDPPQRMEESSRLDPPVDNLTPLLFVARGLVDRLGTRLMEGGHAATVIRLSLELEDGEAPAERMLRLRAPMSSADELWQPVQGLVQHLAIEAPVARLQMRLTGFCPALSRQMDLLARQDARLEEIARQLTVLADTHGPALVRMPELLPAATTRGALVPLVEERRHRWLDPVDVISARSRPARGRKRSGGRR
jgi:DNA polymerase IV